MDNDSATPPDLVQMFIQEVRDSNTETYALLASLTAIVYSTALSFSDEIELMWTRRLSIPPILYFFARYSSILFFCSALVEDFLPQPEPISTCSVFANLGNAMGVLAYLGIQGLLVARAYSLSQSSRGKWLILALLASLYLSGLTLSIYISSAFPGCIVTNQETDILQRINLAIGCLTIVTDSIVFAVTTYQLWGTWRLQRDLKQDSDKSIVSLLFKQGLWRYCFVLTVTLVNTVLASGTVVTVLSTGFTFLQESLSTIFLCEFSLQLRRQNQRQAEEALEVQTLAWSFQNARSTLRSVHDSMTIELGQLNTTNSDLLEITTSDAGEHDIEMLHAGNRTDQEFPIVVDSGAMTSTTTRLSPSEYPWAVPGVNALPLPSDPSSG